MTKEDFASLIIGARMMSLPEFRALLARLGYVHFRPAPFDAEQINEIVTGFLRQDDELDKLVQNQAQVPDN